MYIVKSLEIRNTLKRCNRNHNQGCDIMIWRCHRILAKTKTDCDNYCLKKKRRSNDFRMSNKGKNFNLKFNVFILDGEIKWGDSRVTMYDIEVHYWDQSPVFELKSKGVGKSRSKSKNSIEIAFVLGNESKTWRLSGFKLISIKWAAKKRNGKPTSQISVDVIQAI